MVGIVNGGILQAVAQGFVIDEDLRARRDGHVAGQIPVVDQIRLRTRRSDLPVQLSIGR